MAKILELPKLSPTMEEGTLVRWALPEGAAVDVDTLLAEVETDKATMEFRSFDRGTLLKRLVPEGAVLRLGQSVAILGAPGEDTAALEMSLGTTPAALPATPQAASEQSPQAAHTTVPSPATAHTVLTPAVDFVRGEKGVAGVVLGPTTPRVRRLAREQSVDLGTVRGSGPHGRVTEADLSAKPEAPAVSLAGLHPTDVARAPSSMRRTIARRLTEAKSTVPHFYLEADLDVAALTALRESLNDGATAEEKVSVNDLLVRACALALRAVPEANVSWMDGQLVTHHRADISVAVAIEDGLVTPVVRDADRLGVRAIARTIRDLAGRARARKLALEEMQGGVFSVSNLGMYGVDRFAAVLNPPEGMILAVGAVRDVPVVRDGAVVPGRRCAVTLSCDHRAVDGALGARFLQALRALVERPLRVLA